MPTDDYIAGTKALAWEDVWPGEPDPDAPKILVVPDLHENVRHAEHWLSQPYHYAVFLGDYFDARSPEDGADGARRMAVWIHERLGEPNLIFLLGNHDVHYRFDYSEDLIYPGYSPAKARAVNAVLTKADWAKMKLAHVAGSYLLSHAGFSPIWVKPANLENILARCKLAEDRAAQGVVDPVFGYGELPGGIQKFGGPLAMDFSYFVGIPSIKQIVAHTAGDDVRMNVKRNSINLCLDAHGEVAAVIQGDHVTILRMSQPVAEAQERFTP